MPLAEGITQSWKQRLLTRGAQYGGKVCINVSHTENYPTVQFQWARGTKLLLPLLPEYFMLELCINMVCEVQAV